MAGGVFVKLTIGVFFVGASSQMGVLVQEILGRVRESVQASELLSMDSHLAAWAIEQRPTRGPRDQEEFEKVVKNLFTERGGRKVTKDRWNQTYQYDLTSKRPVGWRIISKGPDHKLGTPDDLIVERNDDTVHINKDPTAIAEDAIKRKQALDRKILKRLRKLAGKLSKLPPDDPSLFRPRKKGKKGKDDDDDDDDDARELEKKLEKQRRQLLKETLNDLDALLKE